MICDITDSIGNTPLIEILKQKYAGTHLYIKLESFNPGGSIKDRVALRMINQCELYNKIKPGMELVEATSGNTGVGVAWIGKHKGYKVTIVTHDKISKEKLALLKHLDANVIITTSSAPAGSSTHYIEMAKVYAAAQGRYYLNQFSSPYNSEAHYFSTAPEIYQQMQGNLDAIICGIGSGGTAMGLARYFREHAPGVKIIAIDPAGSIYHPHKYSETHQRAPWRIEGVGSDFIPDIYNKDYIDEIYQVTDGEAIEACHQLYVSDGVDIGLSSGAIMAAAEKVARMGYYKNIVCISPDSGERYISKLSAM